MKHLVPLEARGERLDVHLARVLEGLSRAKLKALMESGHVLVDARPGKPAMRLVGGETVVVEVPEVAPVEVVAEDLPIKILFEDDDLLVVDKPAGMVVHPGAGHSSGTLVNALLHHVDGIEEAGGEERSGLVHRLDKDTSGCLVVAKHPEAMAALQASFKSREVDKRYLAIVHGLPKPSGDIETLYGRHPGHRQRFTGKVKEGKSAHTRFRTVERFEASALLEVELLTGRTHQIRVHLTEAGFPLLCDSLYGAGRKGKGEVVQAAATIGRQALHAWRLSFSHPRTRKLLSFEAPVPADLEAGLTILREETRAKSAERASAIRFR